MCRNNSGGSGLFIFLALLVHLAAFFFIRIDTTRAELRHQTRIHVTVEYPQAVAVNGQPGDDFWDRLTDPRLFLLPLNPLASLASDEPPLDPASILGSSGIAAARPAGGLPGEPPDRHADRATGGGSHAPPAPALRLRRNASGRRGQDDLAMG